MMKLEDLNNITIKYSQDVDFSYDGSGSIVL